MPPAIYVRGITLLRIFAVFAHATTNAAHQGWPTPNPEVDHVHCPDSPICFRATDMKSFKALAPPSTIATVLLGFT